MDLGTVLVSLGVAAIALLPRIPGFSADERRRARIQRDVDLWKTMPECDERGALAEQIGVATRTMLTERARDRFLTRSWLYGSGAVFVGWILLVASQYIPDEALGAEYWRALLAWAGLMAVLLGSLPMVAVALILLLRAVKSLLARRGAKRTRVVEGSSPNPPAEGGPPLSTPEGADAPAVT